MTQQQHEYLNLCNSMLDYLEQNKPQETIHIDSGSKIEDFSKFLETHKKQINFEIVFSKGWNATAYRIKTVYDKIKNNG